MIQILPVGVVLLDESGAIQLYNLAAHELCSLDGGELGRPFADILSGLVKEGGEAGAVPDSFAGERYGCPS